MSAKKRHRAGQAVRIVDIPADAGKGFGAFDSAGDFGGPKLLADAIKKAARSAFGTAGPAFVARLLREGLASFVGEIEQTKSAFRRDVVPAGADRVSGGRAGR